MAKTPSLSSEVMKYIPWVTGALTESAQHVHGKYLTSDL